MASVSQEDWGGGIFRGRNAPADSVYDALNALVNDERELFERGSSIYKSNVGPGPLVGLADVETAAGPRTIFWSSVAFRALGADDASVAALDSGHSMPAPGVRVAGSGGYVAFPDTNGLVGVYAGSRKQSTTTGTASVTNGSTTVTGAGTPWSSFDVGSILRVGTDIGIIASIGGDTSMTLAVPWGGATAAGSAYLLTSAVAVKGSPASVVAVASLGTPPRLLAFTGTRIYFTPAGDPTQFDQDSFHELPAAAIIIGGDAIRNTAVVFTTEGVWVIENMDLDPIDDAGNIQQTVSQISKDVILWGDPGVAAWGNELLVPAVDDVYLFSLGAAPRPLSAAIRPLYRSYVKAGYKPGTATVHRAHYFLPILDGSNAIVDELVCRLDLGGPAWTRWAGHATGTAHAVRVGAGTRQPKLLAVNNTRVTDLSDTLDTPGAGTDADGTVPEFDVVTSDYGVGNGLRPSYVDRVRVEYEAAGAAPAVTAGWAAGAAGATVTDLTAQRGGGASDGTDYSAWRVGKKLDRVRVRVRSTTANTKLILRRLEVLVRQDGRV